MADDEPASLSTRFEPGYLANHPLPPGIIGALGLAGYQLLSDIAGVGAGRLGPQVFLLVAPDADQGVPETGTQISLHHRRLRDEAQAAAYTQLAAQLAYLRLSGYRLAPVRRGLRSIINVVNPGTGAIVAMIPDKHAGLLGGSTASSLLGKARALPPAGPAPDTQNPELLRQVLLALALRDPTIGGAEAAELADRALDMARADGSLDPTGALEAAKKDVA
jgi:hypothetical protein